MFNTFTAMMPRSIKMPNLKPLRHFISFFAPACERIFIKAHCIESRRARESERIVWQVRVWIFQPGNAIIITNNKNGNLKSAYPAAHSAEQIKHI